MARSTVVKKRPVVVKDVESKKKPDNKKVILVDYTFKARA